MGHIMIIWVYKIYTAKITTFTPPKQILHRQNYAYMTFFATKKGQPKGAPFLFKNK